MTNKSDKQTKIRVLLVEDHVLMRMGLVAAMQAEPDLVVIAEAEDGQQALEAFRADRPDVTIVDLRLAGEDGVNVIKAIRDEHPDARILVLSSYGGGDEVNRAVQNGASGYVLKSMPVAQVLEGVRMIHAGGRFFPREVAVRLSERVYSQLSERELEVLRGVSKGRSNKEIGSDLGITEGTVKIHVKHILSKLGAADRSQAITIAMKRQILQLE